MKQIDKLIINSPYEEPSEHWFYDRETREFERKAGRREAGYIKATEGSQSFDDPGIFVPIEQVKPDSPAHQTMAGEWLSRCYRNHKAATSPLVRS